MPASNTPPRYSDAIHTGQAEAMIVSGAANTAPVTQRSRVGRPGICKIQWRINQFTIESCRPALGGILEFLADAAATRHI